MESVGRAASQADRLPFRYKLSGALGQITDGALAYGVGLFLLFYATAVCGLPGGLAGAAIAAGLVVDAVVDPLIGSVSDNTRSKLGRRLPFMIVGLPAMALSFIALFSLPSGLSTTALSLYFAVLSITFRVSLSLFVLPFQATVAELTDDYKERSSILAWRWGIGMIGTLAMIFLGFGVFFAGEHGVARREAYTPFALSVAAIAIIAGLIACRATYLIKDRGFQAPPSHGAAVTRVFREMAEVFRNRSFRVLFASAVLFFSAFGTHSALGLHANTYLWKLNSQQIQIITLSIFVGLLFGAPLAGPLLKRLEKRTLGMIGVTGLAISGCLPATLRLMGLFPFEGGQLVLILGVMAFLGGVVMATAAISYGSMIADAADEHEHLFHARREGLYFAGWAFANKASTGVGALVAGIVLQLSQFPAGAAKEGVVVPVAAHTVTTLAWFYGPATGLIYAGSVIMIVFYRLDARSHSAIVEELRARRALQTGTDTIISA